jgi:aspartate-semialdehyde dehydrogenase
MTASNSKPLRIGIVGASTLRGKEIAQVLEDRPLRVPIAELRLIDDPALSGVLADAGGEPAIIHGFDQESLEGLRIVFFACEEGFAARHWAAAERVGAAVIDLSGALATARAALQSIPTLDDASSPVAPVGTGLFYSPGATSVVACTVASRLRGFRVQRISAVFFQPVSENGLAGIEELEAQTVKLLSFQPIAQEVFDAQVAFNLLARYGDSSRARLEDMRAAVARDVGRYLGGRLPVPAIQVIQAPVFYGLAFSMFVEFEQPYSAEEITSALHGKGVTVSEPGDPAPTNVSVAGSHEISLAPVERDPNVERGCWLWGAVDNIRLAADNAVRIAEKILATP